MTTKSLQTIYEPIEQAMGEVRGVVAQLWRDVLRLVHLTESAADQNVAEGKMLRPALCLLAAGALGQDNLGRYARLAAAYEAMHIASLAHDDVLDHASLRRGQYALNVLWNEHAAVLGGDYLVARALELLLEYQCPALMGKALGAVRRMAEGELRFFGKTDEDATDEDCIALADTKTASLFAVACSGPALLAAPEAERAFNDFGISMGIAFQLIDDLLDITQSTATLGKPSCGDVAEGKHTLPIFVLQRRMTQEEQHRLSAIKGTGLAEEDREWIVTCARRLDVHSVIVDKANAFIETAIQQLQHLPPSACRSSMEDLARFVLVRIA